MTPLDPFFFWPDTTSPDRLLLLHSKLAGLDPDLIESLGVDPERLVELTVRYSNVRSVELCGKKEGCRVKSLERLDLKNNNHVMELMPVDTASLKELYLSGMKQRIDRQLFSERLPLHHQPLSYRVIDILTYTHSCR